MEGLVRKGERERERRERLTRWEVLVEVEILMLEE